MLSAELTVFQVYQAYLAQLQGCQIDGTLMSSCSRSDQQGKVFRRALDLMHLVSMNFVLHPYEGVACTCTA